MLNSGPDAASVLGEYLARTFAPFMIGGVALVAYISIRGVHLSKRTREVIELAKNCSPTQVGLHAFQLDRLAKRHAINSCALVLAILSVMCFGSLLAIVPMFDLVGVSLDPRSAQEFCIALGGLLAASASVFSVWETIIAPPALRTAVAAEVLNLKPSSDIDREYAISLARRVLGFDETQFVGKVLRVLRGEVMPTNLRADLNQQLECWLHPEFQSHEEVATDLREAVLAEEIVNRPR